MSATDVLDVRTVFALGQIIDAAQATAKVVMTRDDGDTLFKGLARGEVKARRDRYTIGPPDARVAIRKH